MINLSDIPLEDLARGVFPGGAKESSWAERRNDEHVPSVMKAARDFRKRVPTIYMAVLEIMPNSSGQTRALFRLAADQVEDMQYVPSAIWTDTRERKPFKIRLPDWLVPAKLADHVYLQNALFIELELDIRKYDLQAGTAYLRTKDVAKDTRFGIELRVVP